MAAHRFLHVFRPWVGPQPAVSARAVCAPAALPIALLQGGADGWGGEISAWIQAASLAALVVLAVGVWVLVAHLRETRDEARRLSALEGIEAKLAQLLAERGDLDLRRIEHVLLDLRAIQERTEEGLLRLGELGSSGQLPRGGVASTRSPEEAVFNRLLALGYGSIEIVERLETDGGGLELQIEARRDGAPFKGRAQTAEGRVLRLDMHPAHSVFP